MPFNIWFKYSESQPDKDRFDGEDVDDLKEAIKKSSNQASNPPKKKHICVIVDLLITEQELFRTVIPDLSFVRIKTKSTVKSASRRVPNEPVEPWNAFLGGAFNASLSINAEDRKFYKPNFPQLSINSEDTTVDLFLKALDKVNDQRLASLKHPQMWCKSNQATIVKGEPDIVLIGAPDSTTLYSINASGIRLLATVEAKPNQFMSQIMQEIINENDLLDDNDESELYSIYNLARGVRDHHTNNYSKYDKLRRIVHQGFGYMVVNDCQYGIIATLNQTWFICRRPDNPSTLCISPAVSVNQLHTSNRASFWECLRYFEDLSMSNPTVHSDPPIIITISDISDDEGSDDQDDSPPPPPPDKKGQKKKDSDYNPSCKCKFSSAGGSSGVSSRTRSKTNNTVIVNYTELRETKEEILLKYMKNYDHNQFTFGHMLGYGRTGSVFETTLGRKTGALKMVALYKDQNKLEELLNEIKIYIGPLKEIQGIYIPRLLKFGVLHEAFVFILTSLAEEAFAIMGDNITRKEKQLAIKGLQKLHSKGVMHGDIRLENIMVKRKNDGSTCVWWIDFGWSKMTDNVKDLNKELTNLKYLLGMAGTK
ncbi:3967_t:CDS:2 [Paraglomus brasilianum]|uniref:3967_t:CDS:1 n=1 Tax=Paraglomus brasilianum TaxID=144538 RepID=A0A9N8W282_9GLOM|nr:3967_t:CDS:2 [Paraglomus brasilianum]